MTPDFQDLFHFTADDLAANRRGKITQNQRRRLRRRARTDQILAVLFVTLFFVLTLVALRIDYLGLALLMGALGAILGKSFLSSLRKEWRKIQTTCAASVTGFATLWQSSYTNTDGTGRTYRYHLRLDNRSFHINGKAYAKLIRGQAYTAYYVADSEHLLSLEIPEQTPSPQG